MNIFLFSVKFMLFASVSKNGSRNKKRVSESKKEKG